MIIRNHKFKFNFSFFSLSKDVRTNIGQIQIVHGGHCRSFGQRIQMFRILVQQTFGPIHTIAEAHGRCCRSTFGGHSMDFTETRILPNIRVAAVSPIDFLFAFFIGFAAHVCASPNGVLVADGVHVVDVILHGQVRWWVNEKCEYRQAAQHQNGNV